MRQYLFQSEKGVLWANRALVFDPLRALTTCNYYYRIHFSSNMCALYERLFLKFRTTARNVREVILLIPEKLSHYIVRNLENCFPGSDN